MASPTSSDDSSIQLEIRNLYHSILLGYPSIVVAKNIETLMWKKCFHCYIEAYRVEIKELTGVLDSKYKDRGKGAGHVAQSFSQYKTEEKLLQFSSALEKFLAQALAFYQKLISEFEERKLKNVGDDEYSRRQIYYSLLYLGDVARYAEIHSASKQKDWSVSERYYKRARQTMPSSGNPYNQVSD